jgi:hypothetical protein
MTRVLKRPMFRLGGPANEGITSGLGRQGYDNGGVTRRKEMLMQGMGQQPDTSLSQFLIDFGLDIASRPPQGSIFSTAAAAAKDPYAGYKASKASRAGLEQKIGLTAAEAEMSHQDRMKELALKGQTTDLLTEQKRARIMWNTRRSDTNPNGSFNTDTGEDWKSYEEVEAFVVEKAIKSKQGEYTSKVEKDIAINEQKEYIMENIVENPVDAQEIAEIGYQVQNDKLYEEIKDKFDFTQYIIEAEDFGDRLPATEAAGSTQHKADLRNDSPDYENGKIYYNMQDNQFYMFSAAGPGFILITMTQE